MFLRILLLLFFLDASNAFPTTINFTQWDCYNSTPYKPNSTLETNFNLLISSLESQIKTTKHGFLTRKEGSFYGLTMCRGDLSLDDCHDCVKMASAVVRYGCSRATQAIVWIEPCMIRYSNYSFYNLFQQQPFKTLANRDNVTDPQNWLQTLQDTLRKVTFKAANSNESGIKYATTEVWYPPMSKYLYTLAQCIPDLTNQSCSQCLTSAISQISSDLARGGIVLLPSCNLRFEVYQFYTIFATPTTSASPPAVNATLVLHGEKKKRLATKIVVPIIVVAAALVLIGVCTCVFRRKAKKKYPSEDVKNVLGDLTTAESLMFQLGTLEASTNNFSDDQKLGQGGFGSVYKGTLTNGQEIAVKRLSKISGQGVEEFKNEVVLIANLQHRNLVKLLGFCLAGEEKLLVYEFVPNKSLNYFLFDEAKKKELNWPMRYDIIKGIARGLLYLHEDSRPRIIHRDLKTGNILLDANMNPKISDFGLARIFKVEQTEDDTSRVVGTYGYMAPEYAMHGQFSIKSDIYSFGVLVLEIISGKKISTKFFSSGAGDLLTHAWRSLTEGKGLELMDPTLKESYASAQVLRCIEIGLWCAQENTNARPRMSTIVLMLNSDFTTTTIPTPQCPRTFYNSSTDSSLMSRLSRHSNTTASSNHDLMPHSENEETITDIHPR